MAPPAINPDYPVTRLVSTDDLMDIALGVEEEAARRYDVLAERMERRHESELAALFRQLAGLERSHAQGLAAWARREGRRPLRPAAFRWQLPETFGDEGENEILDPYRALSIAVRNEERAFAFYTYLAALASENEAVRLHAEALAREELDHVASLRRMRRRAWHARLAAPPPAVGSGAELRRLASGLEDGAARIGALAARAVAASGHPQAATLLRTLAAECRQRASALAGPDDEAPPPSGSAAAESARTAGLLAPGALTAEGALHLARRDAEEALETYLAIAATAADEEVLTQAQFLAQSALSRLAVVRSQLGEAG